MTVSKIWIVDRTLKEREIGVTYSGKCSGDELSWRTNELEDFGIREGDDKARDCEGKEE